MMQTTGEDYYDLADDELPSANFAARPTSEISDLSLLDIDGLWTFMNFANTSCENTDSEADSDDGPTPIALTPEATKMPQPEMPRTPPETPTIAVTPPSRRQSLRQHFKRMSGVAAIVRRPSSRQKADTAPPGMFSSPEFTPQVPRRALSARLQKRDSALTARYSRHLSSDSDLKARSILGMTDRVLEEERPRRVEGHDESDDLEENENAEFLQPNASFSHKPRVRETLDRIQLSRLRMDFVATGPEELVDSPQSMLGTPLEMYGPPKALPQPQPGRFRPTSAIHGKRGTSTPVSPTAPSLRRPQPPSNTTRAGDDLEDQYQTRVYVSGPICIERHQAMLRKNSVATLDPFASEVDPVGRRPSDLLALEQIVVYFDGMGVSETATDECLDRYWLPTPQQALLEEEKDVAEVEPLTPRTQHSGSSNAAYSTHSRFSFSSASSGASVPQDSPQKRQLIRLRRLLLPALPGLKGLEG
ncbi:hypothetical protein C7974DRAFT_149230 [Boeremia exigua]|uniref:uncharacterized protein n=1 Tax=Boeremia exigua TaxID=749465 RepID=UPI001E8EE8B1|nr:uncharacterized protein C7974DRAFT_149230 [Boeremia exigua]KAH6637852.1 hypothetical protein C7974DRAFT_149230 [Boeremia exigua]